MKTPLLQRLHALWHRRPGQNRRAYKAVRSVAERIGGVLADMAPDLTLQMGRMQNGKMHWEGISLTWAADGIVTISGDELSGHARLTLAEALSLRPDEQRALSLHSLPIGHLTGKGPWKLWIGDQRHSPEATRVPMQWLPSPPGFSIYGVRMRLWQDGEVSGPI